MYFFVWYKRPEKHSFSTQKFYKLNRDRNVFDYFTVVLEKLLNIVSEESSSVDIDETNLRNFASKVPIWDYAGIFKFEYQNLSKDDKSSLLIK